MQWYADKSEHKLFDEFRDIFYDLHPSQKQPLSY